MSKKRTLVSLLLALTLLLGGCGGGSDKQAEAKVNAPTPAAVSVREYTSKANGLSFSYPVGWTVEETGLAISITSVAGLDCGAAIVDITRQVELFLAGHGDLAASVEALMQKNAALFAGNNAIEDYAPNVMIAQNGNIVGVASFSYEQEGQIYDCQLAVTQFGGRVLLDVFSRERNAQKAAELDSMYESIIGSLQISGAEGELTPADLTDLGFPEAPSDCYSYYNPISGQFLIIPDEIDVLSEPYDSQVVLNNADYGLMVSGNWTERFNAIYEASGSIEQCYAAYLSDCLDIVEGMFNQQLIYRDLKYQSSRNYGELIKASFYIDPDGTAVRCFAELAVRGPNDEYVQGMFTITNPDDDAAIAAFNVVMANSQIVFALS